LIDTELEQTFQQILKFKGKEVKNSPIIPNI